MKRQEERQEADNAFLNGSNEAAAEPLKALAVQGNAYAQLYLG